MARNDRRHDRVPLPVRISVQWAVDTAFDLWQIVHPEREKAIVATLKRWERPAPGWTKCNVDAAFYDGGRSAATGVILRDSDGRTCGGTAKWYEHCMSALLKLGHAVTACNSRVNGAFGEFVWRQIAKYLLTCGSIDHTRIRRFRLSSDS